MESKKIILLVNNTKFGDRIEQAFYRANYDVIRVNDSEHVTNIIKKESPHALVVDWDLANGFMDEINRIMRESYRKTAFVLLSKSKGAEDRIHALENGADECLTQIPEVDELVAKVKALVRRIDMVTNVPRDIHIKDISINLDIHEVRKAGKLIDLTYTQFKMLYLLASRREYVFSRDEILEKVWGENSFVTDRTVDVHVKRLREKLGEGRHPSKYIQTIHGMGYRFA